MKRKCLYSKCNKIFYTAGFDKGKFCSITCCSKAYSASPADKISKQKSNRIDNYNRVRGMWATLNGARIYFRSPWEYNYALYLNLLKKEGHILDWVYEPRTFYFEGIKRGVTNYTPDFLVILKGGKEEWHEVKGWMDRKSQTKIKRFRKYYSDLTLIVIDSKRYKAIGDKVGIMLKWIK